MKLIRFVSSHNCAASFGLVVKNCAVAFSTLAEKSGASLGCLVDSTSYLESLPHSEIAAKKLLVWAEQNFSALALIERQPITEVRLLAPIQVAALFDFGLTPRHLRNSGQTWLEYEKDNPMLKGLLEMFANKLGQQTAAIKPGEVEALAHYKCNMNSIVGDNIKIPWPRYTEYLDVEPELAVVYGNQHQPIAGYCIFNDVSARDVQPPELIGGFCLSKDLAQGNQLGPYLVTTDEVGNAFDLAVEVTVNGAARFSGSTSEISHDSAAVFAWLNSIAPLQPGSVMGFGTIPDCTGLDNGDFLNPGDEVVISIERLGCLRCTLAKPSQPVVASRWQSRPELDAFRESPSAKPLKQGQKA